MVGAGGGDLMLAGLAMLCAHAMFKASLFMVVGVIDHATGTRDIRRLAWLGQRSRPLLVIAVGATASMAALPPFLGFVAKEADFETVAHAPTLGAAAPYVLASIVLGTGFTRGGAIPPAQSVILSRLVLVPVSVLALGARDRPAFAGWASPLQVVVCLLILAGALGATVMRDRLAAVLLVGVTGYGCGTI